MLATERDYLPLLLSQYWFAPPVALWRAVELRALVAEDFTPPILDLGCGDGLIAQAMFSKKEALDAGFDPWWAQVHQAQSSAMYRYVQQAQGAAMPYPEAQFATVFSNSVLEHIPDLAPVLREAARVLKPQGRFLATVPSDAFRRLLAGYRERVAVGDFEGAEAYARQVDQRLEHHRYPTPQQWEQLLAQAGLRLVRYQYYIPVEVVELWDRANHTYGITEHGKPWFRWLASPRLRKLGYQRLIRSWVVHYLSQRWRWAYEKEVPENGIGGGLLIIGEKM